MRLLVFGNKTFIRKFTGQEINGVEITGISSIRDSLNLLTRGGFDIVMVNGLEDDSAAKWERIKGNCQVPIALVVREKETNWGKIDFLAVNGFIPERASGNELKARLDAIWRRSKYYQNGANQTAL